MFKRLFAKWFSSKNVQLTAPSSGSDISLSPKAQAIHALEYEADITQTDEVDFCRLSLEQSLEAHHSFVKELRDALCGKRPEAYSPEIIGADDICKLGKWLFNEGRSLKKYPAYAEVLAAHQAFHAGAAEVIRLHQKEEFALAVKLLNTDVKALSEQVETALFKLHEQAQTAQKADGGDLRA